jgi:hypothetical protein
MPLFEQPTLLQTQFAELSANTSTTSTSFVNLLSITMDTSGESSLLIFFTGTPYMSNDSQTIAFQLVVDGTPVRGCASHSDKSGANDTHATAALVYKQTGLAAGSHTITIQWKTDSGTTASIRPVTTIQESGSLLINEVTV